MSLDAADHPSIVVDLGTSARVTTHVHPQHQLSWVPDGVLTVQADGSRWIVQRTRRLWVPGGVEHAVTPSPAGRMLSLYFDPALCPVGWTTPRVVDATGLTGPLLKYLSELGEDADDRRAHALTVLWDVLRPMAVTTIPTTLPVDPPALRVALEIRRNPAQDKGLDGWGRLVGVSARTLSRRFRAETGVSFESWRNFERLNAALPLLAAGATVAAAARAAGYGTASAFIAAFKREIGTTPTAYFGRSDADPVPTSG
ncbi:MAG: helix-turn-helix transcriptional regulator [Nocardia sp.]|nr:helix-turn-helix transcriptional regulator [Nocardia sp.]